ncbi:hypothetical protein JS756_13385 [Streptomyces actuosus]|uniref:Tetracycline repressor TetR C-terminal domain-containing protein n=1 Tax=Streptomyces actuosus TaxID=1885 RepID=A0ABS2VPS4_STRAS|nr:hypothetical protein [Streptomyces actuosus]MBN0045086.1 hypothetical protein [Streptomyces actuosus]
MTTGRGGRGPRHLGELTDVYDFLDEVRLRQSMWVRGRSLLHLESMVLGYQAALGVHGIDENSDFSTGSQGPFAQWVWDRLDMRYPSALGWAVEIERAAEQAGKPALEMFFDLLDEFRASGRGRQQAAPAPAGQPHATD